MYSRAVGNNGFLINHPHSIGSGELGQVGNEAALSLLSMWVGMLDKKSFL